MSISSTSHIDLVFKVFIYSTIIILLLFFNNLHSVSLGRAERPILTVRRNAKSMKWSTTVSCLTKVDPKIQIVTQGYTTISKWTRCIWIAAEMK
jgi:hypothetical protein